MENIKPGRELDALVAEKIFGITLVDTFTGERRPITAMEVMARENARNTIPHYSTDIAAAWEVVERLTTGNDRWFYDCLWRDPNSGKWRFGNFDADGSFSLLEREMVETAPHSICLAALKAVGAS